MTLNANPAIIIQLSGPEKLPGLSRNGPQIRKSRKFTSFSGQTVLPIAEGRDGSIEVWESNEPTQKAEKSIFTKLGSKFTNLSCRNHPIKWVEHRAL